MWSGKIIVIIFCCAVVFCSCKAKRSKDNTHLAAENFEDFFDSVKPNSGITNHKNVTAESITSQKQLTDNYGEWSEWSACRNCRKVRRKYCVNPKCKDSILYEERTCNIKRCRRKQRKKDAMNVLQKIEVRNLEEDDRLYTRWSEWTSCSQQCTTKRHRYCKRSGTCEQNPDVQMAYCYKERTPCQNWIQSMLDRQSKNKKYAYDTDTSSKKKRKTKIRKPKKCGIAYRTTQSRYQNMMKIMGGQITKKNKWPWHVAILNWRKEVFCGGTLISPNWILTAAHCLRSVLYVRLNDYDISIREGSEIEYHITKIYPHHLYNSQTVDNDIALLKLPKSVPFPYACLPTETALPVKQNCTIVGWGKQHARDFMGSKYLREAKMPIVSKAACKRSYRRYTITNNMFCAGYKNGGIDTCSGDSGGGFMCLPKGRRFGWTVQGITSFGEGCGKKGKYGIYTDVRKYLPWLRERMKNL